VEPEETAVARRRLEKHLSAATDSQATIKELLKMCLLRNPCRCYVARAVGKKEEFSITRYLCDSHT
jgi:hypothetical protein